MDSERADREDRTEAATPQQVEKARERGQVARSRDLVSSLTLLGGVIVLISSGSSLGLALGALARGTLGALHLSQGRQGLLVPQLGPALLGVAMAIAPFLAATTLSAVLAVLMQTGVPQLSWLEVDFSRLNPLSKLGQIFSLGHGGWELGKTAAKLVLVGLAIYHELSPVWREVDEGAAYPAGPLALRLVSLCGDVLLHLGVLLALLGAVDYLWSRHLMNRDLRMTKREIRDEMRQNDGDPMIKRALRRRARELLKRRIAVEVPRADVVVINPTHFAVALSYRGPQMKAPRVTAKGVDDLALRIRSLARGAGVPVVHSPRLARDLHRRVPVGREVPSDLYRAVAEVLAFVYRLRPERLGGGR